MPVVFSGPSMRSVGSPTTFSWSIGLVPAGVSNFMRPSPCACGDHGGERALDQRHLERIVLGRARAGEQRVRPPPSAPCGSAASAASTRHGLGATPPNATRPRAVLLDHRRDRDEREGVGRAVAHLVVEVRAADRLGQRHRGDQLARRQRGLDVRRRRPTAGGSRRSGSPRRRRRGVHRLDRRVEHAHRHRHVAGIGRDARVADVPITPSWRE